MKYLQKALRKEGPRRLWKPVERPMCLEPSDRQERCEMQLEMSAGARAQDFAGHTKDLGFCSKCIRKALEDFRRKNDMITNTKQIRKLRESAFFFFPFSWVTFSHTFYCYFYHSLYNHLLRHFSFSYPDSCSSICILLNWPC